MSMSRNSITKVEIAEFLSKLQNELCKDQLSDDQKMAVNKYLHKILFKVEEYTY